MAEQGRVGDDGMETPRPTTGRGVITRGESSFGVVWSYEVNGMVMDTYCPWNGDPRPDWMPDE